MHEHSTMRAMVTWFADWPVAAARASEGLPPTAPVAIIDKGIVIACSAEARSEGVRRGLRVREAQLRCPELTITPYDETADARAFEPVLASIEQIIPGVEPLRPGLCIVRARGAARYYGGERQAAAALLDRMLDDDRPAASIGIADSRFAAEQAAHLATPGADGHRVLIVPPGASPAFLAPMPIETMGESELSPLLRRLGARTLGDFAALDAADVRARFGEQGALAHARAGGLDHQPIVPRVPPRDFDAAIDFEPPLERIDQIAFALRTVAERFAGGFTTAGLVCTGIRVQVTTERHAVSDREWSHPRYFTPADVVDRVRWQLQGDGTDTGLDAPIARVRLTPSQVDAIGNHEDGAVGHAAQMSASTTACHASRACSATNPCSPPCRVAGGCSRSGACSCRGATFRHASAARLRRRPAMAGEPARPSPSDRVRTAACRERTHRRRCGRRRRCGEGMRERHPRMAHLRSARSGGRVTALGGAMAHPATLVGPREGAAPRPLPGRR
jgi:protein ImuB